MKTKYHKNDLLINEYFVMCVCVLYTHTHTHTHSNKVFLGILFLLLYVFAIASLTGLIDHCSRNASCSLNITWFLESLD
jgi:hypothetical protein